MQERFDTVIVGTGFASTFFLKSYLERVSPDQRILVLERGSLDTHEWQRARGRNSSTSARRTFINRNESKVWRFGIGFGGASNCWWAGAPRFMPNDFRLNTAYGVGVDWPLSYDDLEPYYGEAESIMAVSGPADGSPYPRSTPYPQPPHRFTDPDRLLKAAYPDHHFQQPSARARVATANRPVCCATGVCHLCPIDSKFTIQNELQHLYEDPRVTLRLNAEVQSVETRGDVATGVTYTHEDGVSEAVGDLVVLGANALFNPFILLRSGITHPALGRYLNEQVSVTVHVDLDGVDNYQGSTSITGHNYRLYDGHHRSQHAACLIESWNVPQLRVEPGRWRQRLNLRCIFENIPSRDDHVAVNEDDGGRPETIYSGHSAYAQRAMDRLPELLSDLLSPLPVERIEIGPINETEAHILGTTVMGNDPGESIVDRFLVHHRFRNLLVLGSGAFPSCSPANPTLTLSALSLWAADHLLS
jgi:choline dehydrogenase-like flavoprotein